MSDEPEYVREFMRRLRVYEMWIDQYYETGAQASKLGNVVNIQLQNARRELIDFVSRLET